SLDALCKRLDVDNTHRELHGALLDAELLADVYLAMTAGQGDLGLAVAAGPMLPMRTLIGSAARCALRGMLASVHELAAHAARLAAIDKASKGRSLWQIEAAPSEPIGDDAQLAHSMS